MSKLNLIFQVFRGIAALFAVMAVLAPFISPPTRPDWNQIVTNSIIFYSIVFVIAHALCWLTTPKGSELVHIATKRLWLIGALTAFSCIVCGYVYAVCVGYCEESERVDTTFGATHD